ncbi:MAG: methionyl-tRNA formyltransferase [Cyanobacteria bacterium HKST-UBA02]|nr:methionyl-tRNA formyltransferase [Cyanobacteria bacterium HKST-UBA02]
MKVIYLGTPEFAVPTLKALIDDPFFEVVAAVCQPDRPRGRGNKVQAPPVKQTAVAAGIKVFQPEKLGASPETVEAMAALKPDVLVMVAFGQILKKNVLEMARFGVINLHGSLLPELRGAAPINWAILRGLEQTGITSMQTDRGVDTGAMLLKEKIDITIDMDAIELGTEMAGVGAGLMVRTLKGLADGSVRAIPQDDSLSTYAPLLEKEMGAIDWSESARKIHDQVRGLRPWPGAFTGFNQQVLKINRTALPAPKVQNTEVQNPEVQDPELNNQLPPGTLILDSQKGKNSVLVACGENGRERLELLSVQPPGKPGTDAQAWANGVHLKDGDRLETVVLQKA